MTVLICAHAVRGGLKKIEGVRDANVSLKEGVATIAFTPDNRVRLAQVWKVVRDNGFTPRASTIRADGVVAIRGDAVVITIAGSDESFIADNADSARDRVAELRALGAGARVRIEGDLGEAPDKAREGAIRLRIARSRRAKIGIS